MTTTLIVLRDSLSSLTTPLHPSFPFSLIDIFGAMRISSIVNWVATSALHPPSTKVGSKARPSLLQELFGLMVVILGGETFLCTVFQTYS